jgi:hypothetical protein
VVEQNEKTEEAKAEPKKNVAKAGVSCQHCENRNNTKAEATQGPGSLGWCSALKKNVARKQDASKCGQFKKRVVVAMTRHAEAVEEEPVDETPDVLCLDCAFVAKAERDEKGVDLGFYCEPRGAFMSGHKTPHKCKSFELSERAKKGRQAREQRAREERQEKEGARQEKKATP